MDTDRLNLLFRDFIQTNQEFSLDESFVYKPEHDIFKGRIELTIDGEALKFDTYVPSSFPIGKIVFICNSIEGILHQNLDGSICLHPLPNLDSDEKLKSEMSLLKDWMNKFYIKREKDDYYQYLLFRSSEKKTMLFQNVFKGDNKFSIGIFKFLPFNISNSDEEPQTFLALDLLERKIDWNLQWNNFANDKNYHYFGVYLYLNQEPIIDKRIMIKKWSDLKNIIPQHEYDNFVSLIKEANFFNNNKLRKIRFEDTLIMFGYKIPSKITFDFEDHWNMAILKKDFIPFKKIEGNYQLKETDIKWCDTENATHNRFFGRGKLCDQLINSKILILGLGAIGSILAEALTRGGIKNITIIDGDKVESGNICRSRYTLDNIGESKSESLLKKLLHISPYLNIYSHEKKFPIITKNSFFFEKYKQQVDSFDFIFDCTTDMEILFSLDQLKSNNTIVFNLSITNEAQQLVCIYGKESLTQKKIEIFNSIQQAEELYIETGCQYYTFKASYFDISFLVNCSLKKIDRLLRTSAPLKSFIVSNLSKEGGSIVDL
jgi:hypothetical protein